MTGIKNITLLCMYVLCGRPLCFNSSYENATLIKLGGVLACHNSVKRTPQIFVMTLVVFFLISQIFIFTRFTKILMINFILFSGKKTLAALSESTRLDGDFDF